MAEGSRKTAGLFAQLFELGKSIADVVSTVRGDLKSPDTSAQPVNHEQPQGPVALPVGEAHAEAAQLLPQHTPGWHTPRPAMLPVPTYAPAMTAFGILFVALGAVTKWPLSIVGACIFGLAIAKWIGELLHD